MTAALLQSRLFSLFRLTMGLFLSFFCYTSLITIPPANATDPPLAAKIVHMAGRVNVLNIDNKVWQKGTVGQALYEGDSVQTGNDGWAALLMADETMIQLNRNSLFTLKTVLTKAGWIKKVRHLTAPKKSTSSYELTSGQLWMRNKNKGIRIQINTPLVTAGIRGTELDVRIADDGVTYLSVLEGNVLAINNFGETTVQAMEQITARAVNVPFEKRILLSSENTVQWVLHLPQTIEIQSPELEKTLKQHIGSERYYASIQKAHNALHNGDTMGAEKKLSTILMEAPDIPTAWILYAQSLLINGKSQDALDAAEKGISLEPQSLPALLTKSYAHQSLFQLDEALKLAREAVRLSPENDTARLALTRLLFSVDDIEAAKEQLSLLKLKDSAPAKNLEGFLFFALQNTEHAIGCFYKAISLDPGMAEAYLGLALAYMRQGKKEEAIEAIATANLLEPRRSAFLSYWGKMLYEMGRTEKSLDILAQASSLDPADPTPLLYKAHILSDLNRAGEAIETLNQAIEKNDNRAVYRSRFLLDKDLAVKNVTLARLFWKLGMGDWGVLKAWKSVKLDYANSAAHDFWAWALHYTSGDQGFADTSEWLKAFLFKPANANTFNTFNDYTLFFEQPNVGGDISAIVGTDDWQEGSLLLHGAIPQKNLSYQFDLHSYTRDQWRGGLYQEGYLIRPSIKWDVTNRDHLSFRAHFESVDYGDLTTLTKYNEPSDPGNESESDFGQVELGYFRQISPHASLLVHARHRFENDIDVSSHQRFFYPPDHYDSYSDTYLDEPYTTFQILQLLNYGSHQFMLGTFQFWADREYNSDSTTYLDFGGTPIPVLFSNANSDRTRRQETYYLQDVWRLSDLFTIESAIYYDRIENVNSQENTKWSDTFWNPRFGLLFTPTPADTISIVYSRHFDTLQSTARIDPVDIAGHPLASLFEGARMKQWGLAWQHEWQRGCILTRYFDLTLDYSFRTNPSGTPVKTSLENQYESVEASFNQLLTDKLGLNLGYIFIDVKDDEANPTNESDNHVIYGRLSYLHPNGYYAGILQQCFFTEFDNRPTKGENDFNNTTIYLGYEFPNKHGDIRLNVINLFDEHLDGVYLSDISSIWPETTAWLQLKLTF